MFFFFDFTAAEMHKNGFVKNSCIFPKIANFAHFGSRKIGKKQNIKKTAPYDCSRDPKVHLYSFLNKLGHFPRTRYNFRRKKNCKIFAESAKKWRFFGQKSAKNCRKFLKFWKSIKPTKIHFQSKFGVIWGIFGQKMTVFVHFWAIFCPINL